VQSRPSAGEILRFHILTPRAYASCIKLSSIDYVRHYLPFGETMGAANEVESPPPYEEAMQATPDPTPAAFRTTDVPYQSIRAFFCEKFKRGYVVCQANPTRRSKEATLLVPLGMATFRDFQHRVRARYIELFQPDLARSFQWCVLLCVKNNRLRAGAISQENRGLSCAKICSPAGLRLRARRLA